MIRPHNSELPLPGEPIAEDAKTNNLNAHELLSNIAYAGPGARIKVRRRNPETGSTSVGWTTYMFEDIGPVIITYKDRDHKWWKSITPLGGRLLYMNLGVSEPKFPGDRRMMPFIASGATPKPTQEPVSSIALAYEYDILDPEDGDTPEELAAFADFEANDPRAA